MRAVVGIGANLGDRAATMREAVRGVGQTPGLRVLAVSRIYETRPVGPPQPDYLNAAMLVECTLSPRALLDALLAVERALGRTRGDTDVRWGPRLIDLDILWMEGVVVDEPGPLGLTVPHPRLTERAFALIPLLEVAPDAVDPHTSLVYVAPLAGGAAPLLQLGLPPLNASR